MGMDNRTWGEYIADKVTDTIGSWRFIIWQSTILSAWLIYNTAFRAFDPYPYILLNLVLSFQAAYAAPFIMMSQNRKDQVDRNIINTDLDIDEDTNKELHEIHHQLDLFLHK